MDRAVERGHFFSINPAMIRTKKGAALFDRIPAERILTESDGPFIEVSGRTVAPQDVTLVEAFLAKAWGVNPITARSAIAKNFHRLLRPLDQKEISAL